MASIDNRNRGIDTITSHGFVDEKRVIFVSGYFPPDEAVGALRVGKFARAFADDYGWKISVVRPRRSPQDRVGLRNIANSFEIVETGERDFLAPIKAIRRIIPQRQRKPSPHAMATNISAGNRGALSRLSDVLAVPDNRAGWINPATRAVIRVIRNCGGNPVIFSSGPPHSAHVAAARAKAKTNCLWVADLRDPWGGNPYNAQLGRLAQRWNESLERKTLSGCDLILCNTDAARELVAQRLPERNNSNLITVPNGFDDEDFVDVIAVPQWECDGSPVLLHAGALYGKRRPHALLEALGRFAADDRARCPRLAFLGTWADGMLAEADEIIRRYGIEDRIVQLAPVPRSIALNAMAAADGLVLLGDAEDVQVQIPGKLFEYLRLGKPVLSLFAKESPSESYLQDYARHHAVAPPDRPDEIYAALRAFVSGLNRGPQQPRRDISELSRARQAERVNELMLEFSAKKQSVI